MAMRDTGKDRQIERERGGEGGRNYKEIEWERGKEEKRVRQTDKQEDNWSSETNRELYIKQTVSFLSNKKKTNEIRYAYFDRTKIKKQ